MAEESNQTEELEVFEGTVEEEGLVPAPSDDETIDAIVSDGSAKANEEYPYTLITPDELKEMVDAGVEMTIVDGRGEFFNHLTRIPGSIPFSFSKHGPEDFVEEFDKDERLVLVCFNDTMSHKVGYHIAKRFGFTNVYVLKGGHMLWTGNCYGDEYNEMRWRPKWTYRKKKSKKAE